MTNELSPGGPSDPNISHVDKRYDLNWYKNGLDEVSAEFHDGDHFGMVYHQLPKLPSIVWYRVQWLGRPANMDRSDRPLDPNIQYSPLVTFRGNDENTDSVALAYVEFDSIQEAIHFYGIDYARPVTLRYDGIHMWGSKQKSLKYGEREITLSTREDLDPIYVNGDRMAVSGSRWKMRIDKDDDNKVTVDGNCDIWVGADEEFLPFSFSHRMRFTLPSLGEPAVGLKTSLIDFARHKSGPSTLINGVRSLVE